MLLLLLLLVVLLQAQQREGDKTDSWEVSFSQSQSTYLSAVVT